MKLKFWKKDDFSDYSLPPLGAENNLGLSGAGSSDPASGGLDLTGGFQPSSAGLPGMPALPNQQGFGQNFSPASQSPFGMTEGRGMHEDDHTPQQNTGALHGKDLEVIAAKLDAIKSQLDMLNLRLSTLEQRLPPQQQESGGPKKPWY